MLNSAHFKSGSLENEEVDAGGLKDSSGGRIAILGRGSDRLGYMGFWLLSVHHTYSQQSDLQSSRLKEERLQGLLPPLSFVRSSPIPLLSLICLHAY